MVDGLELRAAAATQLLESSAGNPLFIQQTLSMWIDDGILRSVGNGWVFNAPRDGVSIPPTIAALLAARLDRLPVPERILVERAAVIGQVFYGAAVEDLCPMAVRSSVGPLLGDWSPVVSWSGGQETFPKRTRIGSCTS